MYYLVGIVVLIVVAFVWWRWTSVARGVRQRDEKILRRIDVVCQKIDSGQMVSPEEVRELARRPEVRYMLFAALREMGKADLIPSAYASPIYQAESALARWMMHPNELQDAPAELDLVETIRRSVQGKPADFHVFRYRMTEGHWAAKDGWLLGFAGPFFADDEPYSSMPWAFSRVGDKQGAIKPAEIVDWYLDLLRKKGMAI